jgi:hypothetical protein
VNPLRVPAGQQAKALLAALIALLSALAPVLDDGLTASELVGVVVAALIAYGAVFGVRNGASPDVDTSTPQPDSGRTDVLYLLLVVLVVLAILAVIGVL